MLFVRCLIGVLGVAAYAHSALAAEVVTLKPRPDVTMELLISAPKDPKFVALFFMGGAGRFGIQQDGTAVSRTFLNNYRYEFIVKGIATVLVDPPSDQMGDDGLTYDYRKSTEHAAEIKGAIALMRDRFRGLPVWLVGHSRGSTSVASVAATVKEGGPDGIVMSAVGSVSNMQRGGSVLEVDLASIKVPVMIVHHKDDDCRVNPFDGAIEVKEALTAAKKVELLAVEGGDAGDSRAVCREDSHHGFLGVEKTVVGAMVSWIKNH